MIQAVHFTCDEGWVLLILIDLASGPRRLKDNQPLSPT